MEVCQDAFTSERSEFHSPNIVYCTFSLRFDQKKISSVISDIQVKVMPVDLGALEKEIQSNEGQEENN